MTKDMRPRKMPKMAKPAPKRSHKKKVEQAPPAGVVPPLPQVYSAEPERVMPETPPEPWWQSSIGIGAMALLLVVSLIVVMWAL